MMGGVACAQVHERTLQGDFLMALLKDILARRRAQGRPLKARRPQRPTGACFGCLRVAASKLSFCSCTTVTRHPSSESSPLC